MTPQGTLKKANVFALKGTGVEVNYSSSSIAGAPLLDYHDDKVQKSLRGKEINIKQTALGTEVTVELGAAPDGWADSFTLILPEVHVSIGEAIVVVGVWTRKKTSIGGPNLVKGQLATYRISEFKGTAEHVVF